MASPSGSVPRSRPAGGERIAPLDGLRGIAASMVFLVHYHAAFGALLLDEGSRAWRASDYAAAAGFDGVNIFFALSGYLIYGSLLDARVSIATFMRRRARRIYPTFLAVLGLYLVLAAAAPALAPDRPWSPAYVLANALLLPGVFAIAPIVTVAWSLSYEVFFYLGLAALVPALRLRRWPASARVAALLAILVAWSAGGLAVQGVVRSFVFFVPGMLVAEAMRHPAAPGWVRRVPGWLPLVLLAGWVLALPALVQARVVGAAVAVPVFAVTSGLLLAVAADRSGAASGLRRPATERLLAARPLCYVGLVSYSFYLVHGIVTNLVARVLGVAGAASLSPGWRLALFVACLPAVYVACVAAAGAMFRFVEQPLSFAARWRIPTPATRLAPD